MMRRLLAIAAFGCWLTLPVLAQPHDLHEELEEYAEEVHEEGNIDPEHHADAHGGHGHAVSGEALLNDEKFIASLISFACLALILYFAGRRRISASLENRRREIEEAVEEARRREEEAEAKRKEFEERLAQLDSEMEKIREEVIRAGEAERDRIVEDAEAKASLMRKDAKFQIEQQMKQLREDLTREAVEAAVTAAGEILQQKTTATDQERLAKTYLEQVAASAKENRA
jgi:F-type H+-transporting ATPase subunit b